MYGSLFGQAGIFPGGGSPISPSLPVGFDAQLPQNTSSSPFTPAMPGGGLYTSSDPFTPSMPGGGFKSSSSLSPTVSSSFTPYIPGSIGESSSVVKSGSSFPFSPSPSQSVTYKPLPNLPSPGSTPIFSPVFSAGNYVSGDKEDMQRGYKRFFPKVFPLRPKTVEIEEAEAVAYERKTAYGYHSKRAKCTRLKNLWMRYKKLAQKAARAQRKAKAANHAAKVIQYRKKAQIFRSRAAQYRRQWKASCRQLSATPEGKLHSILTQNKEIPTAPIQNLAFDAQASHVKKVPLWYWTGSYPAPLFLYRNLSKRIPPKFILPKFRRMGRKQGLLSTKRAWNRLAKGKRTALWQAWHNRHRAAPLRVKKTKGGVQFVYLPWFKAKKLSIFAKLPAWIQPPAATPITAEVSTVVTAPSIPAPAYVPPPSGTTLWQSSPGQYIQPAPQAVALPVSVSDEDEMDFDMEEEEPFWKDPKMLALLGVGGYLAYTQFKGKKGKKK